MVRPPSEFSFSPASANVPQVCARASCIPMVIDTRTERQRTAAMVALARISEAPLSGRERLETRLKLPQLKIKKKRKKRD